MSKSNLCILALLVLGWTTPFPELLQALRRLRLPSVMLTTLALMYRYLPVLAEEARRMERARASRTFSRKRRIAWQNLGAILGAPLCPHRRPRRAHLPGHVRKGVEVREQL